MQGTARSNVCVGNKDLLLLAALLSLAGLHFLLENGRGLECKSGRSSNLHFLAGLRIATSAGSTSLHLESTEADQLHFVLLNGVADGIKDSLKSFLCLLLGGTFTKLGLNAVNKLSLVHRPS